MVSTEVELFSRSCRFAAGRSGHGSANGFSKKDRIGHYCGASGFPVLPLRGGPLGPRLRTWLFKKIASLSIAERHFSHSWLRPARATAPQMALSKKTGSLPIPERHFSRSRRFAAGRSGHGSAHGLAAKDRIAP